MTLRLDQAIAARGLARSRSHAQSLISDGAVVVDGRRVRKASAPVSDDARIEIDEDGTQYVSRAARKLVAALEAFGVDVAGRIALDMGASTGGFTQVLRERGADPVIALDVGHGQLAAPVAGDPGVRVVEGFNVRYMTPASLAEASGIASAPSVVTGDLSFISLRQVLPAAVAVAANDADFVLLIKPQFEAGRTAVRSGLVTEPRVRADAVMGVLRAAAELGLGTCGLIASPIVGTHGNHEYVVQLRADAGGDPTEWTGTVDTLTGSI